MCRIKMYDNKRAEAKREEIEIPCHRFFMHSGIISFENTL